MIWVAKKLYFFNCLLDGAHTKICATAPFSISETVNSNEICQII